MYVKIVDFGLGVHLLHMELVLIFHLMARPSTMAFAIGERREKEEIMGLEKAFKHNKEKR